MLIFSLVCLTFLLLFMFCSVALVVVLCLLVVDLFVGRLLVDCGVSVFLFVLYGFRCFFVAAVLGSYVV